MVLCTSSEVSQEGVTPKRGSGSHGFHGHEIIYNFEGVSTFQEEPMIVSWF